MILTAKNLTQKMKKLILLAAAVTAMGATAGDYTKYVNPMIGTGACEGGLYGNSYPGATMPFGMVQLSPDTQPAPDWYDCSGYRDIDADVHGFTHTRLSGTGACDLIDVCLFPTSSDRAWGRFTHDREEARPGYYSVDLQEENIKAELTATPRVGVHRYTYPAGAKRRVRLDMDHSAVKGSWDRKIINAQIRQVAPNAVEGYRVITGWAKLRKVYFYAEFSEPIESMELRDGGRREPGADVINGRELIAMIDFANNDKPLEIKVGISGVSCENAKENLETEAAGKSFDMIAQEADAAWDKELAAIDIAGDDDTKSIFYTALYHSLIQPNIFNDVNGEYMAPDYTVAKVPAGENQYTTFSLWDTYRATHPLYTILAPEANADFVNSMIRHCDVYGYLPIWGLWGQDNYCMIGNHAIPVIVDAVLKGTPGIDAEKAYEAVKRSATVSHPNSPYKVWEEYGYMPENIQTQSVSITLEMAYDDWCVAQLAKYLGKEADYEHFMKRASNIDNLYDESCHFFAPKDDKGEWIRPFDPLKHGANGGNPFTEGNAWQYYWYVPQDVDHLIELTGGKKAFEAKLDEFFTLDEQPEEMNGNVSGLIGQYAHGNEPSHHAAYLYNYVDRPDKSAKYLHRIMTEMYKNNSSGLIGNDDCGQMSAWYVFSALGFYPVNPASGEYDLGAPLVEHALVHLPNGNTLEIKAPRKRPDYTNPKEVRFNGDKLTGRKISHKDLMNGGLLEFKMGK